MKPKSFESALKQLEAIVEELEDGELPLEKAVAKFEEGIALSRTCSKILDETEKRITLLIQSADGSVEERSVTPEDLSDDR